jgi:hypothetical protein
LLYIAKTHGREFLLYSLLRKKKGREKEEEREGERRRKGERKRENDIYSTHTNMYAL